MSGTAQPVEVYSASYAAPARPLLHRACVEDRQIRDDHPHLLEVTIRLDGASANFAATLDSKQLNQWSGPTDALSQSKVWATTRRGALGFGTITANCAVSEVKVRELAARRVVARAKVASVVPGYFPAAGEVGDGSANSWGDSLTGLVVLVGW
jgi:hypothetical protein